MQNNESKKEKIGEQWKKLGERGGRIVWAYDCMVFKYSVIHPYKRINELTKLLPLQDGLPSLFQEPVQDQR